MTTANPSFDGISAASETAGPKMHRRRGRRILKLVLMAAVVSFVASKLRGSHDSDPEDYDDGV